MFKLACNKGSGCHCLLPSLYVRKEPAGLWALVFTFTFIACSPHLLLLQSTWVETRKFHSWGLLIESCFNGSISWIMWTQYHESCGHTPRSEIVVVGWKRIVWLGVFTGREFFRTTYIDSRCQKIKHFLLLETRVVPKYFI